jgi:hypothetical protein
VSIPVLPSEGLRIPHNRNGDLLQTVGPRCTPERSPIVLRDRSLTSRAFDSSDRTVSNHRDCDDGRPLNSNFQMKPSRRRPLITNSQTKHAHAGRSRRIVKRIQPRAGRSTQIAKRSQARTSHSTRISNTSPPIVTQVAEAPLIRRDTDLRPSSFPFHPASFILLIESR